MTTLLANQEGIGAVRDALAIMLAICVFIVLPGFVGTVMALVRRRYISAGAIFLLTVFTVTSIGPYLMFGWKSPYTRQVVIVTVASVVIAIISLAVVLRDFTRKTVQP